MTKHLLIFVAVLGLAALIHQDGCSRGRQAVQAEWDKAKIAQQAAEAKAIHDRLAEIEQIQAQHELDKQLLKKDYADEIARSRALSAAAPGLRVSKSVCSGFTGQAQADGPNGGDGGDSATRLVPPAVDADFGALEQDIEAVFAGCRVAQDFLKMHGMAP